MSTNNTLNDITPPDGGGGVVDIESIQPTIRDDNDNVVQPVYVETVRKRQDSDNATHTTLCGETTVEAVGEKELSVTIEGIVLLDQLEELKQMQPAERTITLIDNEGVNRGINFDRLTYEEKDELGRGSYRLNGTLVTQPAFEFQLQTVDDSQD